MAGINKSARKVAFGPVRRHPGFVSQKGPTMTKRILASVLAASLALTSLATAPARAGGADSGEIGRFLLGAGALFIIGSAINNNNRGRVVTRRDADPVYRVQPQRVVPAACLRVNRWNNGPTRFFGRPCLNSRMQYVNQLPGQCKRTIWTHRNKITVFSAHCLRHNGWVFG